MKSITSPIKQLSNRSLTMNNHNHIINTNLCNNNNNNNNKKLKKSQTMMTLTKID